VVTEFDIPANPETFGTAVNDVPIFVITGNALGTVKSDPQISVTIKLFDRRFINAES
jgi:hypothetical protein